MYHQIYESSLVDGEIRPVISSPWNDITPSVSPDRKKFAFISKRSGGIDQVWVYDLVTRKYTQISGYSDDTETWVTSIEWLDNHTLLFVSNGERLVQQDI